MGRNLEIVLGFHETFAEADFAAIRDAMTQRVGRAAPPGLEDVWEFHSRHVDPEITMETRASSFSLPDIPEGTILHGWRGWLGFWRSWLEPWEHFETDFGNFVEIGDNVVLDFELTATGRGSGLPTHIAHSQVWTVRDEKVVRVQVFDTRDEALAAAEADE